jgi:hypothetical protein
MFFVEIEFLERLLKRWVRARGIVTDLARLGMRGGLSQVVGTEAINWRWTFGDRLWESQHEPSTEQIRRRTIDLCPREDGGTGATAGGLLDVPY